eukprot:SAG25_NODE_2787_length_1383_cov_5.013495_1_plen_74_part_10
MRMARDIRICQKKCDEPQHGAEVRLSSIFERMAVAIAEAKDGRGSVEPQHVQPIPVPERGDQLPRTTAHDDENG